MKHPSNLCTRNKNYIDCNQSSLELATVTLIIGWIWSAEKISPSLTRGAPLGNWFFGSCSLALEYFRVHSSLVPYYWLKRQFGVLHPVLVN